MKWTRERDVTLLAQIVATGEKAFLTKRGKTDGAYNQHSAWNNSEDGIITLLKQHERFKGVAWPIYHSVLAHVDRLLQQHATLPLALQERCDAERAIDSEFDRVLVAVAALKRAALATMAGSQAKRPSAAADVATSAEGQARIRTSDTKHPNAKCEHGRPRSTCKECGGISICQHMRPRAQCKECGGSSFCAHGRRRSTCKECGGSSICAHGRQRHQCKECGGSSICAHGRQRRQCGDCGFSRKRCLPIPQ
mmetsp:Transcript_30121/g.70161  ORF Transcript_30121/g.70161 Transcript_30121/m.70161 type:complete len:251 (-) Transcript_30121:796-1548(-)